MKSGAALHPIAAIPAAASHLEMVQIAPRLQKLDTLLEVQSPVHRPFTHAYTRTFMRQTLTNRQIHISLVKVSSCLAVDGSPCMYLLLDWQQCAKLAAQFSQNMLCQQVQHIYAHHTKFNY